MIPNDIEGHRRHLRQVQRMADALWQELWQRLPEGQQGADDEALFAVQQADYLHENALSSFKSIVLAHQGATWEQVRALDPASCAIVDDTYFLTIAARLVAGRPAEVPLDWLSKPAWHKLARIMRLKAGASQADLAHALGLSVPTISTMETGRQRFTAERVAKWSEASGVHPVVRFQAGPPWAVLNDIVHHLSKLDIEDAGLVAELTWILLRLGEQQRKDTRDSVRRLMQSAFRRDPDSD